MVTVKDLGDTVELAISVPVEEKELANFANATGYTPADARSYKFTVTMKFNDYVQFVEDTIAAFTKLQLDRADIIKLELDEPEKEQ